MWELLLPDSAYPERDSVAVEAGGRGIAFPHPAPADSAAAARVLPNYPWMDELTLEFALEGVSRLGLGSGPATDLLAVSLSTTDAIGHAFGPGSREVHDQILRVDRMLGTFFQRLFAMRDSARIIIALTGDHGVTAFPEVYQANTGHEAGHVDLSPLVSQVRAGLAARGVDSAAFWFDDGPLFLNRAALERAGVKPDSVVAGFQEAVRKVPGVARADRMEALAKQDTVKNAAARRWLHMYPPDIAVQLVVTLKPHYVWGNLPIAMHGQPSDDDAHVPIVFYGAPFKPGAYREQVRVVDMAPTLAAVLGIWPTERVDGKVLRAALRSAGSN
jgi:arylsulfatase A-like enzyme